MKQNNQMVEIEKLLRNIKILANGIRTHHIKISVKAMWDAGDKLLQIKCV